jgi:hypothetical protein
MLCGAASLSTHGLSVLEPTYRSDFYPGGQLHRQCLLAGPTLAQPQQRSVVTLATFNAAGPAGLHLGHHYTNRKSKSERDFPLVFDRAAAEHCDSSLLT